MHTGVIVMFTDIKPNSLHLPYWITWWEGGRWMFKTLRPRQNVRQFADDTFKRILYNGNVRNSIKISLKFVPKVPINNITALVQMMAWPGPHDKPLSEPMMVRLLTHVCVNRPQWVKKRNRHIDSRQSHGQHYSDAIMSAMASQITPASRLVTQQFFFFFFFFGVGAQNKENIKAPRLWPLWGEFIGDQWIPHTKGQ